MSSLIFHGFFWWDYPFSLTNIKPPWENHVELGICYESPHHTPSAARLWPHKNRPVAVASPGGTFFSLHSSDPGGANGPTQRIFTTLWSELALANHRNPSREMNICRRFWCSLKAEAFHLLSVSSMDQHPACWCKVSFHKRVSWAVTWLISPLKMTGLVEGKTANPQLLLFDLP